MITSKLSQIDILGTTTTVFTKKTALENLRSEYTQQWTTRTGDLDSSNQLLYKRLPPGEQATINNMKTFLTTIVVIAVVSQAQVSLFLNYHVFNRTFLQVLFKKMKPTTIFQYNLLFYLYFIRFGSTCRHSVPSSACLVKVAELKTV